MASTTTLRLLISGGAVTLLIAQFVTPRLRLEPVALGLAVLAVLPWLSSIIESAKLPGGWEVKFREVEREQARQREDLDAILRFLVESFVTDHELVHLRKLASNEPFAFTRSDAFEGELRRLLGLRLIGRRPGKGLRTLFRDGDDVGHHLVITDRGHAYLRHRESVEGIDAT